MSDPTSHALVNLKTGEVENLIVATRDDSVDGYLLVENPPLWVTFGTKWDGKEFVRPPVHEFSTADEGMM